MAYERDKNPVQGDSLDAFVSNTMQSYGNQIALRNAEKENAFLTAIVEQNLSLEEQLDYREQQRKEVSDDPSEKKRLTAEITNLSERITMNNFSEEYSSKLSDANSGISSIDSVISWLKDQALTVTNSDILTKINSELANQEAKKFDLVNNLLNNQTQYALQDKSQALLTEQVTKVTTAKNKALLAGDNTAAGTYDLQLKALNKALTESTVSNDMKNFAVSTITGQATATALLDAYNSKISSSSATNPITMNGTTYASAQEFWKYSRDSYVADASASGYFTRLDSEITTSLKVKNSNNTLSSQDLKTASSTYDALLSRPELAAFAPKIQSAKANSLQTGANYLAGNILNNFAVNYDLTTAVTSLNSLKSLGVNIDDAYTKLITDAAVVKNNQIKNVVEGAQALIASNPELSISDAVNQSIGKGAGTVLAPNQSATTPIDKAATDIAAGVKAGTTPADNRLATPATNLPGATPQPVVPTPAPATPAPVPTSPAATPANPVPTPAVSLKQLDYGMTDPAVKELQKFLNSKGYTVASSGDGSAGLETTYFGDLTKAALQKFQSAQGIVSQGDAASTGYGRLGPQTLSAIQKLMGQ